MRTDKKIIKYKDLKKIREIADRDHRIVVFTSGCYDLLHLGHVAHFNFCKSKGDILVVNIGNDETVKSLKGPTRPINDQNFRAKLVAAIEYVDHVIISEEHSKMDHTIIIEKLQPNIYVVNADDSAVVEKRKLVNRYGGKLVKRYLQVKVAGEVHSVTRIEKIIKS